VSDGDVRAGRLVNSGDLSTYGLFVCKPADTERDLAGHTRGCWSLVLNLNLNLIFEVVWRNRNIL
jgi:hypothetical protein